MFSIHFRRFFHSRKDYTLIATNIPTLEEALAKRMVGGDLVVHTATGEVVDDVAWLFNWEKTKPDCYARQAMRDSHDQEYKNEIMAKAFSEYPYI